MKELMEDTTGLIRDRKLLVLFFIIVGIIYFFQLRMRRGVQNNGVFTVATIVEKSYGRSGYFLQIAYTFDGKRFERYLRSKYGGEKAGDMFFIKVLPSEPGSPVYQEGHRVPPCLQHVDPPPKGWKHIPSCIN